MLRFYDIHYLRIVLIVPNRFCMEFLLKMISTPIHTVYKNDL